MLLVFLGKTRPTLTLIGFVALPDASLSCLAVLVKSQEKSKRRENHILMSHIFAGHVHVLVSQTKKKILNEVCKAVCIVYITLIITVLLTEKYIFDVELLIA